MRVFKRKRKVRDNHVNTEGEEARARIAGTLLILKDAVAGTIVGANDVVLEKRVSKNNLISEW